MCRTFSPHVPAAAIMVCSLLAMLAVSPPAGAGRQDDSKHASPLKLTIKTDKSSYGTADVIHITLMLKNPTKQAVPVHFATGQKFDILLRKASDSKSSEPLWQWSRGMMFTQMVTAVSIDPGKTMQYEAKFPQADAEKPVKLTPGSYELEAFITTMGSAPRPTASTKFKVK